jgi:hypothetical protein
MVSQYEEIWLDSIGRASMVGHFAIQDGIGTSSSLVTPFRWSWSAGIVPHATMHEGW